MNTWFNYPMQGVGNPGGYHYQCHPAPPRRQSAHDDRASAATTASSSSALLRLPPRQSLSATSPGGLENDSAGSSPPPLAITLLPLLPRALPASAATDRRHVGRRGQATRHAAGKNERILRVGVDVSANERIVTRTNDRAHLVFLDGSALTIGPSSEMVIDRFVYDPNRQVGDLAMSATRGAFRFVGGAIIKKTEVVVRTPTASVGIRGSIMTIAIGE